MLLACMEEDLPYLWEKERREEGEGKDRDPGRALGVLDSNNGS